MIISASSSSRYPCMSLPCLFSIVIGSPKTHTGVPSRIILNGLGVRQFRMVRPTQLFSVYFVTHEVRFHIPPSLQHSSSQLVSDSIFTTNKIYPSLSHSSIFQSVVTLQSRLRVSTMYYALKYMFLFSSKAKKIAIPLTGRGGL